MSWLRTTGPKPTTRYSFTVNFESHPELEPLAHHLWSLSPAPTSRNQAILQLLQAGFQAMLLQDSHGSGATAQISPAPPEPAPPRSYQRTPQRPATADARSPITASPPPPEPSPASAAVPPTTHQQAGVVPSAPADEAGALSPAAKNFINQFDD